MDAAVLGFAFALGLGTFFSPCAIALVPSYAAYFIGTKGEAGFWPGLRFGAWAAGGVLAVFSVAGMGLYLVRTLWRVESSVLSSSAAAIGLFVGFVFTVLGVLVAFGRGPSWSPRLGFALERTPRAMVSWGALFSLGSLGCSLPLALAALALAVKSGSSGTFVIGAYAAGLAGLVFVSGPVLGVAGPLLGRFMARAARSMQIAMGIVLTLSGLYVVWYYARQINWW